MKIEALIEIAESTLPLNKKVEKVNSNKLELAILFLLLEDKDVFKEIFPVREIIENLEVIKPYFHQRINTELFESLSKINEFSIKCLQDDNLFETFNAISGGEITKTLTESLNRGYLINEVIEKGLLEVYLKKSIFDNGFINTHVISEESVSVIEAFVKAHDSYFTPEYFSSLEEIHEKLFFLALPKLLKFYEKDFNDFYIQFKEQFDLRKVEHVSLLSDNQVSQLLHSPNATKDLFPENGSIPEGHTYLAALFARLPVSELPSDISKKFLEKIIYSLDDEMPYCRKLVSHFGVPKLAKIFEDKYSLPDTLQLIFDELSIQSGDYSKIKDIGNLNNFSLSDEQVISAVVDKVKNSDYFYMRDVTVLKQFDSIKERLAEEFLKIPKKVKEEDLFSLLLGDAWYIERMGVTKFLNKRLEDADNHSDFINEYKDIYPKQVVKIFMKKINTSDHYYRAEEDFITLLNAGLISNKEILPLMKEEKLSIKVPFLDCLTKEEYLELKKANKKDSTFIHSVHADAKEQLSYVSKLKPSELAASRNIEDWIDFPLTHKQSQTLWDKIKDKKNIEIKEVMFALLEKKKLEMSEELYEEIYSRAKKLKGFEDAVSVEEDEQEESLEKKFTKAIASPAHALKALESDEFDSILTQKNVIRVAKKVSQESGLVKNWIKSKTLNSLIDAEVLEALLAPEKSGHLAINALFLPDISDDLKIKHLSKLDDDLNINIEREFPVIDMSLELFSFLMGKFNRCSDILSHVTASTINNLISSNHWAKVKLISYTNGDDVPFIEESQVLPFIPQMESEARKSFLEKFLSDTGRRKRISEDLADLMLQYIPDSVKARLDDDSTYNFSGPVFRKFVVAFDKIQLNLNQIIENKDEFTSAEFLKILKNVSSEQLEKATRYNSKLKLADLTEEELDVLLSEENMEKIPSTYWAARHIVSVDPLTAFHLENFFASRYKDNHTTRNTSKLSFLSAEEKQTFLSRLLKVEDLSLDTFLEITNVRDLMGYSLAQLEPLVFNLNSAGIGNLFYDFEQHAHLFSNMTEDTKIRILEKIINKDTPVEQVQKLLVLLPPKHPMRLDLITKSKNRNELERLIGMADLTDTEIQVVAQNIIDGKHFLHLSYGTEKNIPIFLNIFLSQKFWTYEESDGTLSVRSGGVDVMSVTDSEFRFSPFVNAENQNYMKNMFKALVVDFPEKITGVFVLNESKFIPDREVPPQVLEALTNLDELSSQISSTEEVTKAVLRFAKSPQMKAIATRRLNNQENAVYLVELIIDESVLKNRTKNISEELITVLQQKEQSIKSFLNKALVPNEKRTFGFELEFSSNRAMATVASHVREVTDTSVSVKNSYTSSNGRTWDFKVDGSVKAVNGFSMELASPILEGKEGITESREVLNGIFNKFEVVTGQKTNGGLHVHHDIKDLLKISKERTDIVKHFYVFQESLYALCDYWRQKNSYCRRVELEDLETSIDDRIGFNVSSYGTMEFRMRESMQDVESIIRWILLTQKVVDSAALSMTQKMREFTISAEETLEVITHEKALQLKSISDEDEVLAQINRFTQAKIYSQMVSQK